VLSYGAELTARADFWLGLRSVIGFNKNTEQGYLLLAVNRS